jgi:hypothetical protein
MGVHIKVAGAWKECDNVHIKVAGAWKTVDQVHVKVAGVWKETLASGPVVSPVSTPVGYFPESGVCYARVEYKTDGVEYKNPNATTSSTTTSRGNWLDSGAASEVWLERTIVSGSLTEDPGAGRHQLSSNRLFGCYTNNGFQFCQLSIKFYDAASGGNEIGSCAYTLTADATGE